MTDSSGNAGRAGTFTAPITYGQPGSGVLSYSKAVVLAGTGARAVGGTAGAATAAPSTYTIEAWFKTSTTSGGKLVGFENGTGTTSNKFDRTVFMDNFGKLSFGGWTGSGSAMIVTPSAYNDGQWHYLVVTAVPQGSHQFGSIYVDGALATSGNTTGVTTYNGYWRIGFGAIGSGSGYPTSANFNGSIDNVAIYSISLSAVRIGIHYAAR
jgi:hypothetical protein